MGQQFTVAPPLTETEKKSPAVEADSPRSLISSYAEVEQPGICKSSFYEDISILQTVSWRVKILGAGQVFPTFHDVLKKACCLIYGKAFAALQGNVSQIFH